MKPIQYLQENTPKVIDALRNGDIKAIESCGESVTDLYTLFGLKSGLFEQLASSFPDPRNQLNKEVEIKVILSAGVAGCFSQLFAISQSPYALHSFRILAELELNATVLNKGEGISKKGTKIEAPFHGDCVRKLLDKFEYECDECDESHEDHEDHEDHKLIPLERVYDRIQKILKWYNDYTAEAFLKLANYQPTIHILDCTKLIVNFENENYQGSGVVKEDDTLYRGYKLGTLRSLLDEAGIITHIAFGSIEIHDLELCRMLLRESKQLKAGDLLIIDRGFISAEEINHLKKQREVDVVLPLRSDMQAFTEAVRLADMEVSGWQSHPNPTRKEQKIKEVEALEMFWAGLEVPIKGVVVRKKTDDLKKQNHPNGPDGHQYMVFITTMLSLTAKNIILTYELRPEQEEDYRQLKSEDWKMDEFTSTNLIDIFYHVILVLLAYNLFIVFANTEKGQDFAKKTIRALKRQMARSKKSYMLVVTADAYAVLPYEVVIAIILRLSGKAKSKMLKIFPLKDWKGVDVL